MPVPNKRGPSLVAVLALSCSFIAVSARADEIKLKDGKKLYGVIVSYEDNMFKVKTDFGFVLVEKDKIASITPTTPADKPDASVKKESAVASSADASSTTMNASAKTAAPNGPAKNEKSSPKIGNAAVKPEAPPGAPAANADAPSMKGSAATPANNMAASAAPAPPKEPELPANREEVTGNLYTNYTHGFRMYKAPSWNLIEEARTALPNAIVAMGTSNESTLMVVGEEKTKDSLEVAAAAVEKRLHEVYEKYHRGSERKTVVGGLPAIEYQYTGTADDHDWSGKLVVVARGKDLLTVLAMTHADSDLIQIQENVISRSIASLDFNVH